VLCIDGPTASGKGTLATELAQRLGYHRLDSGLLYRLLGLAAERAGIDTRAPALQQPGCAAALGQLARELPLRFEGQQVWLGDEEVSAALRSEAAGMAASRVAALPEVRAALLELQRNFRRLPGLVADGRDMGTVVFPDAALKVYLTASAEQRAQRRHLQLMAQGIPATMAELLVDLQARDERDRSRSAAPLKPAEGARLLDNSEQSIEQSVQQVLDWWQACNSGPNGPAGCL